MAKRDEIKQGLVNMSMPHDDATVNEVLNNYGILHVDIHEEEGVTLSHVNLKKKDILLVIELLARYLNSMTDEVANDYHLPWEGKVLGDRYDSK